MKIPFLSRRGDTPPEPPKITYSSSLSATNKDKFKGLLLAILRELPDLLAVSVIDLKSGELLATHHVPGKLNPAKAAAYYAELIRQKQRALNAFGLREETIADILVTLTLQWHLLRLLPDNRYFVHLMVNSRDTNLGIVREVMRAHTASPQAA